MSARVTRSSARNGKPTTTHTSKSAVSDKRRQRKQFDEVHSDENNVHDNDMHVTPPKQRKSCAKANALSPSTLLDRLSLSQEEEDALKNDYVPETPKTKIDNARKVLNAAETEELYGREKEITELNEFLSSNGTMKTSASIYISGQPGKYF